MSHLKQTSSYSCTFTTSVLSLAHESREATLSTENDFHSFVDLNTKNLFSSKSNSIPTQTTFIGEFGGASINSNTHTQNQTALSSFPVSETSIESTSSTLNSATTAVALSTSDDSSSSIGLILCISLPIILLLLIILACCLLTLRRKRANENADAETIKTAIPRAVPNLHESIGSSPTELKDLHSECSDNIMMNLQDDDSEHTKESLPREALTVPFSARVKNSQSHNSVYSFYDDLFVNALKIESVESSIVPGALLASRKRSPSTKGCAEIRINDANDFIDQDLLETLTDYTDNIATHSLEEFRKFDSRDSIASAGCISSIATHDTTSGMNDKNIYHYDFNNGSNSAKASFSMSDEYNLPNYEEQKKKALFIELENIVNEKVELNHPPNWMHSHQFVNPSNVEFSHSIDGFCNELEQGYDLDDYVAPAPTSHVAIMSYTPRRAEEMNIQNGDLIGIERQLSGEWCLGQNISQQRKRGLFPLHAVTAIKSGPSQSVRRGQFSGL